MVESRHGPTADAAERKGKQKRMREKGNPESLPSPPCHDTWLRIVKYNPITAKQ